MDGDTAYVMAMGAVNDAKADITRIYTPKPSCKFEDLPTSGQVAGDAYPILDDFTLGGVSYPAGSEVFWASNKWNYLPGHISVAVVDNLTSTANAEALSANQGRVLDGKVTAEVTRATGVEATKLDKNADITAGTKCKITYDAKGLVTGGADLAESDIPTLAQSKITNLVSDLAGKQPTLTAGTGISIVDNVISNTQTSAEWGNITGTLSTQTDLKDALDEKQDSALVTSISASSDDIHYPSAKCVYDAVSPKSVVTVSSTGTATDEVQYITIDGTEKKIAGGSGGASITIVSTDPTSSTTGTIGAMQYNSANGVMWVCTSVTDGYTWIDTRPHIIERTITESS